MHQILIHGWEIIDSFEYGTLVYSEEVKKESIRQSEESGQSTLKK